MFDYNLFIFLFLLAGIKPYYVVVVQSVSKTLWRGIILLLWTPVTYTNDTGFPYELRYYLSDFHAALSALQALHTFF